MLNTPLRKKLLAIVISLVLWAVLVWCDYATGVKIRFGPIYAVPVMLFAWYFGRWWGIVAAIISAGLRHGIQIIVLSAHTFVFYEYWDLFLGLLAYGTFAWATCWVREILEREAALNDELQQALHRVRTLEGLLSICAWCKKVRNEEGSWVEVENYVAEHSNATWTHGICPECQKKFKEHGFN
jgi:glucose-6-phosphate-specific signal transduction histidine kinase